MKNRKRILSVTIKRMIDDSPDTSDLGEYANRPESEYAVNRGHDVECASQTFNPKTIEAKRILEHVQQTIRDLHNHVLAQYNGTLANEKLDSERDALDDAYNEVGELLDTVSECDCWQQGARDTHSYEWFNPPVENYQGIDSDETRKYCLQDYERMESLERGNWCFIGIRAEAEIMPNAILDSPDGKKWHGTVQHVTSGGLWGIESDSEKSYLAEVEQDELANLRSELTALGFSKRAISQAFKDVQHKDE